MNGGAVLILEFIVNNSLYNLTFELWFGTNTAGGIQPPTPRLSLLRSLHPIHSSLNAHCKYNEWWWSDAIGNLLSATVPTSSLLSWGQTQLEASKHPHWHIQFTAAWLFQCLIMSIMNGVTVLRLEFIVRMVPAQKTDIILEKWLKMTVSKKLRLSQKNCLAIKLLCYNR